MLVTSHTGKGHSLNRINNSIATYSYRPTGVSPSVFVSCSNSCEQSFPVSTSAQSALHFSRSDSVEHSLTLTSSMFHLSANKVCSRLEAAKLFKKSAAVLIPSIKSIHELIVKHVLQINLALLPQQGDTIHISQQQNENGFNLSLSCGLNLMSVCPSWYWYDARCALCLAHLV